MSAKDLIAFDADHENELNLCEGHHVAAAAAQFEG